MNNARLRNLKFRLYLEGVRVPMQQGQLTWQVNAPAQGSLAVVPSNVLPQLLDGTQVALFFWDDFIKDWLFLFDGEYRGRGRSKGPDGRAYNLYVRGYTHHWFKAPTYLVENAPPFLRGEDVKFGATGALDPASGLSLGTKIDSYISLLNPTQIEQTFKDVLTRIRERNAYYKLLDSQVQMIDRIFAAADGNITALLRFRNMFEGVLKHSLGVSASRTSAVIYLLSMIADAIYYDWVEVPAPLDLQHHYVFKPRAFSCAVPPCNVLFPSHTASLQEQSPFDDRPTRMSFPINAALTGKGRVQAPAYWAPREVNDHMRGLETTATPGSANPSTAGQVLSDLRSFLTKEELIRGIVHASVPLTQSEYNLSEVLRLDSTATGAARDYLQELVDYKFAIARVATSTVQVGSGFHPWAVPGLPGLALDNNGPIFGLVESLALSFAPGSGSSILVFNDAQVDGDQSVFPLSFPTPPAWISSAYVNGSVYKEMLGLPGALGTGGDTVIPAARALWDEYVRMRKRRKVTQFAAERVRRPVMSETAYWAKRKAAKAPFDAAREAVVKRHIKALGIRRILSA